jgi:hypothetical protein
MIGSEAPPCKRREIPKNRKTWKGFAALGGVAYNLEKQEAKMSFIPYLLGAFVCVAGAGLGFGGYRAKKKSAAVLAWPTAAGSLDSAEVVTRRSSGTTSKGHSTTRVSYEPVVRYSYSVDGKEYKGRNIGMTTVSGGKGAAEKRVGNLKSEKGLKVYYDPKDPKESYLDPKADGSVWLFFVGAALIVLGIVVVYNGAMFSELFSF